jgi:hypothetical protein
MWERLGDALALVLVLEGLMPFLNPGAMRRSMASIARFDDRTLRVIGLSCMLLGVAISYLLS